jgi:hypothetical protein
MKKRLFLVLGIAVLFLVLITGLTGCDSNKDPSYLWEYTIYNKSTYTITMDIYSGGYTPSYFTLRPNSSQRIGSNTSSTFLSNVSYTGGNGRGFYWDRSANTFYNY